MNKKNTLIMSSCILGAALFTQAAFAEEAVKATETTTATEAKTTATEEKPATTEEKPATTEAKPATEATTTAPTTKPEVKPATPQTVSPIQGLNQQGGWVIMPGKDEFVWVSGQYVPVISNVSGWAMMPGVDQFVTTSRVTPVSAPAAGWTTIAPESDNEK
ncbi:hypothetical protein E8L90_05035 [Brevibacillus antibioticus]|uniref:Uncharacterized protein n=1 Tax=Brevibacillus antibioticus TaxID=2570228 RepID=A0A4U2Y346_9BACL|nr:hypothetical protein [Brevibacillus antibioticus]TKI54859.1 hypothetical protein E8L90_05035 [Brevibacillus antibioticus]